MVSNSTQSAAEEALLKSMLISADMAHGIHPNYSEKHEELHRPLMNGGVVIKQNANQRYATTSVTSLILKEVYDFALISVDCQETWNCITGICRQK